MDEHIVDLINRDIDGEASPEESTELRSVLGSDPEVKALHDGMRRMVAEIEAVESIEPPATLRDDILADLRRDRDAGRPPETAILRPTALHRAWFFRYVYAVAAGLVLGFILRPVVAPGPSVPPFDASRATGTMAPLPPSDRHVASPAEIIAGAELTAAITLDTSATAVVVTIELEPGASEPLTLAFEPNQFVFEGIDRPTGDAGLRVGNGFVEVSGPSSSRVELRLRRFDSGNAPVRLQRDPAAGTRVTLETGA